MIEQRCPLYDIYFIEFCAFEQVEIPSERLMRMTFDTQTKVYNETKGNTPCYFYVDISIHIAM